MHTSGKIGPVALALAGAIIGYLLGAAPSPAAAAPPPAAVEHRVMLMDFEDYKEEPEYKALEKSMGSPWRAQFEFQQRVLSKVGEEGYELVAVVVPKTPATSIFYLKKAK